MSSTLTTETREPLLAVRNLNTTFKTESGLVQAVRGVNWEVYPGEVLGVVGESGSGKSVTMASIMGLVPSPPGVVTGDSVMFEDKDLLKLSRREMRKIRGREIAMIFQDPMTSFNPVRTIGYQLSEAIRVHDRGVSKKAARARTIELLSLVGVPSPDTRFDQFPHEYSGGMRQRAMIAMAIINQPKLIIADEPTTALDVTIQAQILDVLKVIQTETDAATVLITHDLGLIAEMADRVLVMYAGRIVEEAPVLELFTNPRHPYTLGLLGSIPRLDEERPKKLISIDGLPPDLRQSFKHCPFSPRCPYVIEQCKNENPVLMPTGPNRMSACWRWEDLLEETGFGVSA